MRPLQYIDSATGTEHTVAVPEQGGKGAISQDPLPPGSVYTAAANSEAKVALFRLEVSLTPGTGKLRTPTGLEKGLKESLNRVYSYLQSVKDKIGLTHTKFKNPFHGTLQSMVVIRALNMCRRRDYFIFIKVKGTLFEMSRKRQQLRRLREHRGSTANPAHRVARGI